ncbi:SDR family NAD(P)-dependent oxidoreductase [Segetibacter sp. 3557_3]|uniref:oxidoreductase n=1 Tax=Segetibacter sp. 3557_3 TaxID=2547429 RepID=UPI001058A603|nr:oxidoreductase [Segetibacter sp. 3557_3]TDH21470.1 SDR family NAD(P)-dependent oxidoreductase [Segetibacter sp. 3557_3]
MNKIIFITGVSSGFGRELAKEAAIAGNTVIGTVRQQAQTAEVDAISPGNTFGYVLDVNDHDSVKEVISAVVNRFGRLDVVVNNAGYGLMGAVEETSMEEARAQMETNFFGALAVTQAVLPVMREAGQGHIVQFSSIAGLTGSPGLALYNASKHALEGMSEALYLEVKPLGIKVTIVEPGPFRTNWAGGSMHFTRQKIDAYNETSGKVIHMVNSISGAQPGDPVKGAQAVLKVIESADPPLRLLLGKSAIERAKGKLEWVQKDLDNWESVGLATDF